MVGLENISCFTTKWNTAQRTFSGFRGRNEDVQEKQDRFAPTDLECRCKLTMELTASPAANAPEKV